MTEEQIERRVEAMTDAADRLLMDGRLTQQEYDAKMANISAWADRRYAEARRAQP